MVFADQKQYITSQWNLSMTVRNFIKINLKKCTFSRNYERKDSFHGHRKKYQKIVISPFHFQFKPCHSFINERGEMRRKAVNLQYTKYSLGVLI